MSNLTIGTLLEFISNFLKMDNGPNDAAGVAYGGGMAGNKFDILTFVKKPQVIIRILSVIFSIIVFGCISSDTIYKNEGKCPLNDDYNACGFGIAIGVIAFLAALLFLLVDARFDMFSNVKTRRRAVIADMIFSCLWSFMWFVCFCYLADAWRKTTDEIKEQADRNKIQAAIAFSFFSIFAWIALDLLALLRYRQGVADVFSQGYEDPSQSNTSNYAQNQPSNIGLNDPYRQAPFNTNQSSFNSGTGGYQQPTY